MPSAPTQTQTSDGDPSRRQYSPVWYSQSLLLKDSPSGWNYYRSIWCHIWNQIFLRHLSECAESLYPIPHLSSRMEQIEFQVSSTAVVKERANFPPTPFSLSAVIRSTSIPSLPQDTESSLNAGSSLSGSLNNISIPQTRVACQLFVSLFNLGRPTYKTGPNTTNL